MHSNMRSDYPHLEIVTRLNHIPIVESSWNYAGQIYTRIKHSNSLVSWTLGTAELSLNSAMGVAIPTTVAVFGGPINKIDQLLCKSLDIVEQRVPNIYLPPRLMYTETKEYVSSKFVRPMLKRADSVKEIGNAVLASKYTAYAADKLEDALNAADKYVDIYLPDAADQTIDVKENKHVIDGPAGNVVHTIHHVDRFSRKLQRRLTKRTLQEAKALKERSQESMHVLLYVAELIATDPKLAVEKARELWLTLSENEPENQARPATLEQLIVMLTRESARRVVHLVNFTRAAVVKLPSTISRGVNLTTQQCKQVLDHLVKSTRLDELTYAATDGAKDRVRKISGVLKEINNFTNVLLENLALAVAGQKEIKKRQKRSMSPKQHNNHAFHSSQNSMSVLRTQRATHRHTANNAVNNSPRA